MQYQNFEKYHTPWSCDRETRSRMTVPTSSTVAPSFGVLLISIYIRFVERDDRRRRPAAPDGEKLGGEIFIRNEEKRRPVYRPFLRQCVRTRPNEQAATHGADKKEESLPSPSLPLYSVPSSITSGTRWGRWRYVEDRRRGGQARWVVERAGYSRVEGGCARGRAPEGGTREGIEAIDVFT